MKSKIELSLALFFLVSLSSAAASVPPRDARTEKISIESRTDKTALWTGDLLTYTVRLFHDRDIEFVTDHLNAEKISLNPFVIRSITFEQRDLGRQKKSLEIAFQLSTYETGKNELTIPAFTLFYFRHEGGFKQAESREAIAQTVRVPALPVGLRSTLSGTQLKLRDYKPVARIDRTKGLSSLALGIFGLVTVAGFGARSARSLFRRRGAPRTRRISRRSQSRGIRQRLTAIQALSRGSQADLERFYIESDRLLRDVLQSQLNRETSGLTAEEVTAAVKNSPPLASLTPDIAAVLQDCDRVRYGRGGSQAAGELAAGISQRLESIVRRL